MQQHGDGSTLHRLGDVATWVQDRELGGVMSTVQRHTQWMDAPIVAKCMGTSTFDPRMLRTERATVYLILPHHKLSTLQALLRLWIGSILRMMTQDGGGEAKPVLFLLDESAMLGQMKCVEEAVTQYRKFGAKLWFFWQSLDQMKVCFGDRANVILGNLDIQQYFGVNDFDTADAVSKRLGTTTIATVSVNKTISESQPTFQVGPRQPGSRSESTSITTSELGRRLLLPEEILVLPEQLSLVFVKNLPVIPAELIIYYADKAFKNGRTGKQRRGVGVAAGVGAGVYAGLQPLCRGVRHPIADTLGRAGAERGLWQAVAGGADPPALALPGAPAGALSAPFLPSEASGAAATAYGS